MSRVADHLMIAPVVLPLVAGAAMLLVGERRRRLKAAISVASTFALIGIAIALLAMSDASLGRRDVPRRSLPAGRLAGRRSGSCSWWTACRRSCCS